MRPESFAFQLIDRPILSFLPSLLHDPASELGIGELIKPWQLLSMASSAQIRTKFRVGEPTMLTKGKTDLIHLSGQVGKNIGVSFDRLRGMNLEQKHPLTS